MLDEHANFEIHSQLFKTFILKLDVVVNTCNPSTFVKLGQEDYKFRASLGNFFFNIFVFCTYL